MEHDESANVAARGQRLGALDGALRVGPLSLRAPRATCPALRAKFCALGVEAKDDQIGAPQVGKCLKLQLTCDLKFGLTYLNQGKGWKKYEKM